MVKYMIVSIESFRSGEIPEVVKNYLKKFPDTDIVLDESSRIKTSNPKKRFLKSKQTQGILKLNTYGRSRGILTGTFMTKSPCDAYDQSNFVLPDYFGMPMSDFAEYFTVRMNMVEGRGRRVLISYDDYMRVYKKLTNAANRGKSYFVSAMNQVIKNDGILPDAIQWIMEHREYTPFMHVDELWNKVKEIFSVVRKKDCLDLPPKVYTTIRVELSPEVKKLYTTLLKTRFTDKTAALNPMSLYYQLQDICNGYEPSLNPEGKIDLLPFNTLKIDALKEAIDQIDMSKEKVVVWSNRSKLLIDAEKAMIEEGYACSRLDGECSANKKEEVRQDFIAGKTQIIFMNQGVGGTGVDYLGCVNYAIYLCSDYSVEKWMQSIDRIDRMRDEVHKKDVKNIITIQCAGTIDEKVTENLKVGIQLMDHASTDPQIFDLYNPEELYTYNGEKVIF